MTRDELVGKAEKLNVKVESWRCGDGTWKVRVRSGADVCADGSTEDETLARACKEWLEDVEEMHEIAGQLKSAMREFYSGAVE